MKIFGYQSYNFIDKDPIIDYVRTVIQNCGKDKKTIASESGVSKNTIYNWLYGGTKRPQAAPLNAVLRVCDHQLSIAKLGTSMIIEPTPITVQARKTSSATIIKMRQHRAIAQAKRRK